MFSKVYFSLAAVVLIIACLMNKPLLSESSSAPSSNVHAGSDRFVDGLANEQQDLALENRIRAWNKLQNQLRFYKNQMSGNRFGRQQDEEDSSDEDSEERVYNLDDISVLKRGLGTKRGMKQVAFGFGRRR